MPFVLAWVLPLTVLLERRYEDSRKIYPWKFIINPLNIGAKAKPGLEPD